jgi:hypothetical protein
MQMLARVRAGAHTIPGMLGALVALAVVALVVVGGVVLGRDRVVAGEDGSQTDPSLGGAEA